MEKVSSFYFFDDDSLEAIAHRFRSAYQSAQPFSHAVMDDFLPDYVANRLAAEFPSPTQIAWKNKTHEHSKKLACDDETKMPPFTRSMLAQFNSAPFVRFLEELTGIRGLIVDPSFEGGGLHQIEQGGFLHVHADFNRHPTLPLDRRLNLLFYLNKDWRQDYGGALELWNKTMTQCEARILPIFNRCVVFSTTDTSYHGHPHPLTCPPGITRKSIAFYYYTNGRPANEISFSHSTLYKRAPGEKWFLGFKHVAKKIVPPIVLDFARYVYGKMK